MNFIGRIGGEKGRTEGGDRHDKHEEKTKPELSVRFEGEKDNRKRARTRDTHTSSFTTAAE